MRQERFKMEREGLVEEGQEVVISERSAVTGQYTYLVEPSVAMSGIYRTRERIMSRKGNREDRERLLSRSGDGGIKLFTQGQTRNFTG